MTIIIDTPFTAVAGALTAARRGWKIIRLEERGKRPAGPWRGRETSNPATIGEWWKGPQGPNYGIVADASQLLILDEDTPGALDTWQARHGITLPDTYTVATGKGRHLYFTTDGHDYGNASPFRAEQLDVDVRGAGYVVGPGCVHPDGVVYTVTDPRDPAPVPSGLHDYLTQPRPAEEAPPAAPASAPSSDDPWLTAAIRGALADLADTIALPEDAVDRNGNTWETGALHARACRLLELSNCDPGIYPRAQARQDYTAAAPAGHESRFAHHWDDAERTVGDRAAARPEPLAPAMSLADEFGIQPTTPPPAEGTTTASPQPAPYRFTDAAAWIFDQPDTIPALWGHGSDVLWAEGESLILAGPPGTGKTTITGQLCRALLGLDSDVLGYPVRPAKRVLYLAMDRPRQIARSLARTFRPEDRDTVSEHLAVWPGPPPADLAKNTELLLALAQAARADVVIVDSLKDAAIGLTDDEVGAGWNRARQTAIAAGVDLLELHHTTKRGPGGTMPRDLAGLYGSAWITSGAGSVLLIEGEAGDTVVKLHHLKQPAETVGPLDVEHDHAAGRSRPLDRTDPLALLRAANATGLSAPDLARLLNDTDKPTENQKDRARRKLAKLESSGLAEVISEEPSARGGRPQKRYRAADFPTSHPTSRPILGESTALTDPNLASDETAGHATAHPTSPTSHLPTSFPTPPYKGVGTVGPPLPGLRRTLQLPRPPHLRKPNTMTRPLDPQTFPPAMRPVLLWHQLLTDTDALTSRTGLGLASVWEAIHAGDYPMARHRLDTAAAANTTPTRDPLHRDGNTFLAYRRGWMNAADNLHVIHRSKGWAVMLLTDGYYRDRAMADRMADYFREEVRLAYEGIPNAHAEDGAA